MFDKVISERVVYYFDYVETDDYYEWILKVETLEAMRFTFKFSYEFLYLLGASTDDNYTHISTQRGKTPPFVIRKGKIPKVKKPNAIYFTNFPHNYYPNADAFCKSLTAVIMELGGIYVDAKPQSKALFTVEELAADIIGSKSTNICIFTPHPSFNITLHPFIMKMLHLANTSTENKSTQMVTMPTATREFFYIYTNIIPSHTFTGAVNKLRVINNNTVLPNEKIMINFSHYYYHPVSQLSISNIQIHITDNISDFILPFQKEVTCLLHFRRCSSNNTHSM